MRLITLCTILSATVAAVAAQEIIAAEEWFESMRLNRGLVTRNLRNKHAKGQRYLQQQRQRIRKNNKRSLVQANVEVNVDLGVSLPSTEPRLEKRVKGFPPRSEIEQRATDFNSFQADALVAAPVMLHIVHETPSTVSALNHKKGSKKIKKAVVTEQKLQLNKKKKHSNGAAKKNKNKNNKSKNKNVKRHFRVKNTANNKKHGKKVHKKHQQRSNMS
ncbi:hypothetical protein BGX27_011460 [Mortierella sp. AM989]|nr:hypothetical protein BGX27_011460 [Mortierella sp. AM989]